MSLNIKQQPNNVNKDKGYSLWVKDGGRGLVNSIFFSSKRGTNKRILAYQGETGAMFRKLVRKY